MTESTPLISEPRKGPCELFKDSVYAFTSLPKDLWLVDAVTNSQLFLLFSIFLTLPIFLCNEFGYNDTAAGAMFGAVGGMIAFYSILLGPVVDRIGIKKSAMIASIIYTISGMLLAIS